jgi:hypothetical protein
MSTHSGHEPLLVAYPARLRRKHGAELIETMHEMAGAQGAPTRGDKWRLVLDGLRERLRPPARRPYALVAVALALIVGALGAAGGSWLGTSVHAAMPDATSLAQQAFPTTQGLTAGNANDYLWTAVDLPAGTDRRQAADGSRQKLAAAGWEVSPIRSSSLVPSDYFTAVKDHVQIQVEVDADGTADGGTEGITGFPQRQASFTALTLAGTLLGLLAGWLAGVALAHRIRASRRPRTSALLTTAGLALVIPSAVAFVASLVRYLATDDLIGDHASVHTEGFAFGPTIDLLGAVYQGTGWTLTAETFRPLLLGGFALVAVATVLAQPRRSPESPGAQQA